MRNPLRKRFAREIKNDFGKYLVLFLFFAILVGLVSGFLVDGSSIETTFYKNFETYNIEDGHITFTKALEPEMLQELEEKGKIKLYDLNYADEDIDDNGTTLRIFKDRKEVDKTCMYSGRIPEAENEIAIDRLFAENNDLAIGDKISLKNKEYVISGFVALVDYGCLFENESDMMFNAINFGVGIMTEEGFEALNSTHISYNYAWLFDEKTENKQEARQKSEDLVDVLEDVLKAYDTKIIQAEVDAVYDQAEEIQDKLQDEFETASDEIEKKIEAAAEEAFENASSSLGAIDLLQLYLDEAEPEAYLERAAEKQGTTKEALIAKELGITEQAFADFKDAFESMEDEMDSIEDKPERPVINLEEIDEGYENDMDYSLDTIRDLVMKIEAAKLYDTTKLSSALDELEGLMHYEFDKDKLLNVDNYVLRVDSKSVNYCMDDMSSDRPMFMIFYFILVVLLAFIFAVITSNTITSEASVIGTLRASGFTKAEMIRHYMFLPMLTAFSSAIVGNILGYSAFAKYYLGVYYGSFCLAPFETRINAEAFLITTLAPLIAMFVINYIMLARKLKLSPMKFLRRDLAKKKQRRAMLLNKKLPFLTRFRLRILFQNIPAYITLFAGIFIGGVLLVFGLMFTPLLEDYAELITESKICEYQYVLKEQAETKASDAEKYCLTTMNSDYEGYMTDEISIYGIEENSKYILADIQEGTVLVSNGMADKFNIKNGDEIRLLDSVTGKEKIFEVSGEYQYDAALCIFMNRSQYLETFNEKEDYFTGYFTNTLLTDLDEDVVATIITQTDLRKVSDQMVKSMGGMMAVFSYFGVFIFILLMYIMTKQIIEKNTQSIAMTKILGFRNGEIAGLYLVITSLVVVASLLISAPLIDKILQLCFEKYLYMEITGYIPYIVSKLCFVKMFLLGVCSYALVSAFMMRKINRIEKSEALKNVE